MFLMKEENMKFIIGLLLFFVFTNVNAKVYYSEYSDFSNYTNEKIESSELVDVERERRYKWYKSIDEGNFYIIGENPSNYQSVNLKLFSKSTFSGWSLEIPQSKFGRTIESRRVCDSIGCIESHMEYRYSDVFYYHYRMIEIKKDGYHSFVDGYKKNELDYQDYYRYRIREKIDVPSQIVITNTNEKVEDFILSTTEYEVNGNLNLLSNGVYNVEIKTNFITVPVIVQVLIEDRIKKIYEQLLEEKDNMINSAIKTVVGGTVDWVSKAGNDFINGAKGILNNVKFS